MKAAFSEQLTRLSRSKDVYKVKAHTDGKKVIALQYLKNEKNHRLGRPSVVRPEKYGPNAYWVDGELRHVEWV